MTFSVYTTAVETFVPMLQNFSKILDKGADHAKNKNFDGAVLVNARLAPDMYPLASQVQFATDQAKDAVARLMGVEPPRFEGKDETIDALKARIDKTIEYLRKASPEALAGAEDRDIAVPLGTELVLEMKGGQFLRDWALPHFYFHLITGYDILRHNGVDIGKRDYVSHIAPFIRPRSA